MYTDHWNLGVNPEHAPRDLAEPMPAESLPAPWQVLARLDLYLQRLALTDAQRLWLRTQVLNQLAQTPTMDEAGALSFAFAKLQQSLGTLSDGDELEARLGLALGSALAGAGELGKSPSRWLREQMQPPVQRQTMASLPMRRSWRALFGRLWQRLRVGQGKTRVRPALSGEIR
ncbi:MAG: hypothetical protein ACP5D5_02565 [Acidithiobacillus sp.]|uniref:hypothetical protein n=1 Tax=Acidithiobacillus sp. TaxID=1872118 RepID=UPI0025B92991|nr:hypothetical protein [Acidithiobacillus sp.]